jgi:hypothetical protein
MGDILPLQLQSAAACGKNAAFRHFQRWVTLPCDNSIPEVRMEVNPEQLDEALVQKLQELVSIDLLDRIITVSRDMTTVLKEMNAQAMDGGKPDPAKLSRFHELEAEFKAVVQELRSAIGSHA